MLVGAGNYHSGTGHPHPRVHSIMCKILVCLSWIKTSIDILLFVSASFWVSADLHVFLSSGVIACLNQGACRSPHFSLFWCYHMYELGCCASSFLCFLLGFLVWFCVQLYLAPNKIICNRARYLADCLDFVFSILCT